MLINVRRYKEANGIVEIDFEEIGHLLYHEIILNILINELGCEKLSYYDKITDIDSRLRWNDIEFDFNHHYIFGNFIAALPEHADSLEQLANQAAVIISEKAKQHEHICKEVQQPQGTWKNKRQPQ